MEYLKIKGHPIEHAKTAHDNGYYFEAIHTLHSWMECKLRELLLMQRKDKPYKDWPKSWDLTQEFSLIQSAKALFVIDEISNYELSQIVHFNKVRNNMVHKLFYEPYYSEWKGVEFESYEKAYGDGLLLCDEIESKSAEKLASNE